MLRLININRRLGDFALTDINLEVSDGQYYVLLGRSGSGKTQLLELIAGLEHPDSGTIILDDADITRQRIQDRKVGIVFQDYAVFPHMTVFGNIAYPLKARKEDKRSIKQKVEKAANAMNITHILGGVPKSFQEVNCKGLHLQEHLLHHPGSFCLMSHFLHLILHLKMI